MEMSAHTNLGRAALPLCPPESVPQLAQKSQGKEQYDYFDS